MVNRNETNTPRRTENVRDSTSASIRAVSNLTVQPKIDDVIMSLANSYENKRARQVTEWELMRRSTRLAS